MTDNDKAFLERLEALAASATPGPWSVADADGGMLDGPRFVGNGETCVFADEDCPSHPIADCSCNSSCRVDYEQEANAAFIAACDPAVIVRLIALAKSRTTS